MATAVFGVAEVRNLIKIDREGANVDQDLRGRLCLALQDAEDLDETAIRIEVNTELVWLPGDVSTSGQKYQAERLVRPRGIVPVRNEIQVAGL